MRSIWVLLTLAVGCGQGSVNDIADLDDGAFLAAFDEIQAGCGGGKCDAGDDWAPGRFAARGPLPPTINVSWDPDTLDRWNHQDQGVASIPLSWLYAVEHADRRAPFFDDQTAARFGFHTGRRGPRNPDGLPLGFTVRQKDGRRYLGFSCAACHGAEIAVNGVTVRIAGGHGRQDFIGFADALGEAFRANLTRPDKAARMLARIVTYEGLSRTPAVAREILETVTGAIADGRRARDLYPVPAGPGRIDAAGRGANRVFGAIDPRNLAPAVGAVSNPPLWDVPRYDWSHYNGAIRQNLARNTVEALGIGAEVALREGDGPLLSSSVDFTALIWLEAATRTLRSPRWPEAFGPLDGELIAAGRVVYRETCSGCHGVLDGDRVVPFPSEFGDAGAIGLRYFALEAIGTDPTSAEAFARRTVLLSTPLYRKLGIPEGTRVSAADAFAAATGGAADVWFDALGASDEERDDARHGRPNLWRAQRAYRARPLNGIWASAPFLHNGSVASLTELLGPAERRRTVFKVGSNRLDPGTLGYDGGAFTVDTRLPGNANRGHAFDDRFDRSRPFTAQNGVVGRALSPSEIRALVELMKALEPID